MTDIDDEMEVLRVQGVILKHFAGEAYTGDFQPLDFEFADSADILQKISLLFRPGRIEDSRFAGGKRLHRKMDDIHGMDRKRNFTRDG